MLCVAEAALFCWTRFCVFPDELSMQTAEEGSNGRISCCDSFVVGE